MTLKTFCLGEKLIISKAGEHCMKSMRYQRTQHKVVKHNGDSTDGYSVLVEDRKNNIERWMDCWIEDGDIRLDWNQYIFSTTDPADKRAKEYQDNNIFFENVSDAAIYYLVEKGLFVQDSDGKWSYGKMEAGI